MAPCERSVLSIFFCRLKIRPAPCERSLIKPPFTSREHWAKSTSVIHFSGGSSGETEGGRPSFIYTKLRPDGLKRNFFETGSPFYLRVLIRHCFFNRSLPSCFESIPTSDLAFPLQGHLYVLHC